MSTTVVARVIAGATGLAAMGVAGVVASTPATATIVLSPASAYCVGTTYTITMSAADAAALFATSPIPANTDFVFEENGPSIDGFHTFAEVPYVPGQGVTVQWTPTTSGWHALDAHAHIPPISVIGGEGILNVNVVPTASGSSSCSPSGSAGSVPVIGGLLGSISA